MTSSIVKKMNRRGFLRRASILTLGGIASTGLPFTKNVWAKNGGGTEETLNLSLASGQQLTYHLRQTSGSRGRCFFVHGIGDASSSFANLIETVVASGYDALYYDLPGSGENNGVEAEFEENCQILKQLMEQHALNGKRNYAIGHSMGGLVLLLTFAKYAPNVKHFKVLTIEPSFTQPDKGFYGWVSEPPIGVGYEGLLESVPSWSDLYAPTYAANLALASQPVFKDYVDHVYENFDGYHQMVIDAGFEFTYVYGDNSSGTEYRAQMADYPQVQVHHFADAGHWVHVDAEAEFTRFFKTNFLKKKYFYSV